ncbi:DUF3990 domain-containing protein [Bacillus nitratireducens]|uniref:DUF3990 domain-containing protein n=1 Tax=Bacillus nitratireducens TaxID=2026193 RepID=UPI0008FEA71A|nr:DUF3990 domain-containing protein [Bacillus nitratireducens]OJD42823.1 hypothetical protein BAU23_20715 [Bacillus nitratireducens]
MSKIMYHGTNSEYYDSLIEDVQLSKCKQKTDFGKGFYLTTKFEQASEHAEKRSKFRGEPIVFVYEVDIGALRSSFEGKIFHKMDIKWAEFIYYNRSHKRFKSHSYDYVFGGVADGYLEDLIEQMDDASISREDMKEFHEQIAKYPTYDQLSVHNSKIFEYNIVKLQKVVKARERSNEYSKQKTINQ